MIFQESGSYLDYLSQYGSELCEEEILQVRNLRMDQKKGDVLNLRDYLNELPDITASVCDFSNDIVKLGSEQDISNGQREKLRSLLEKFIPWKKGPWDIFGVEIDSEWRSDLKWERIKQNGLNLEDKKVADIGCNNGYFMFRMLDENPRLVVGLEPYLKHYYAFHIVQNYVRSPILHFEPLGIENLDLYPNFFDTIFCLGILYHHTDPIALLRKAYGALDKGGEIYIDCQGISGDMSYAMMPRKKYTSAKGFWWLPTKSCLQNWMLRTQFRDIVFFYDEPLAIQEQRQTKWSPHASLEQFLDPNDFSKTIEGYPAPRRFYLRARK